MFYAHGGLVEEREGLLPVLARRRFWELNGVYPVYFVWETGLLETLTDIARRAIPRRAARGARSRIWPSSRRRGPAAEWCGVA